MDNTKELLIETRIKNNRLYSSILENSKNVLEFCEINQINTEQMYGLINLRISPYYMNREARGVPRPIAQKIESILEKPVEWLFPPELYLKLLTGWRGIKRSVFLGRMEINLETAKKLSTLETLPKQGISLEKVLENKSLIDEINTSLASLPGDRERFVIEHRFGLNGNEEKTLDQTAELLCVSRERVRQIEAKAIRRLRHPVRSDNLRDYKWSEHEPRA